MASKLKQKKQSEAAVTARYEASLRSTKAEYSKRIRKFTAATLTQYLSPRKKKVAIREPLGYKPVSRNLERNLCGFLTYTFSTWKPPHFLTRAVSQWFFQFNVETVLKRGYLQDDGSTRTMFVTDEWSPQTTADFTPDLPFAHHEMIWFLAVSGGESLPKYMKGTLTAKETHYFLKGPFEKVWENLLWALCEGYGVISSLRPVLCQNLPNPFHTNVRCRDVIAFFAKNPTTVHTCRELLDFLTRNADFSLKGRTLASLTRASNEWHALQFRIRSNDHTLSWEPTGIPDFYWETARKIFVWKELCTGRQLFTEGKTQKHCVGSYIRDCVAGRSAIFTMCSHEKKSLDPGLDPEQNLGTLLERITIEYRPKEKRVVQARGRANRILLQEEKAALNQWAARHGISTKEYW